MTAKHRATRMDHPPVNMDCSGLPQHTREPSLQRAGGPRPIRLGTANQRTSQVMCSQPPNREARPVALQPLP